MASESKRRRTKAEIETYLAQWRESGASVRQFCSEHGLAPASFYQWLSERGMTVKTMRPSKKTSPVEKTGVVAPSDTASAAFRPVHILGPSRASYDVTLHTPSGYIVALEGCSFDAESLAKIVGGLR